MCACVAIRDFLCDCPCIGQIETKELYDMSICSLWGFPRVVRQFVVNFLIGEPFFRICEFYGYFFCEPIVLCFYECL